MSAASGESCTPEPGFASRMGVQDAAQAAAVLKAVGDPLRLRMLSAIATDSRGESCVCDLQCLTDASQPTVSHHLRLLKEAGLVISERRGTWVYYRVAPSRADVVAALLDLADSLANAWDDPRATSEMKE
ncbi:MULTISPECIES: helix-turn-helix transcriptional regulator [unclassified Leucobacter]|uniref:ArsR/SmtB family transcription factor n=1 Tax=unclassified Leucobacter TaxID=2621730 RepID=UPI00203D5998|nr:MULTISPECIES: metalloregulator ArsR/SmtB family transcription factor [unclassified Leucobacter]